VATADGLRQDTPTVRPHTITFTPVGETVACLPDETVLVALLRSGAKVLFGCRGGGCGTCKMQLLAGAIDHGRCSAAVLPDDEKAKGAFLSCQARPLGDVTVELTAANRYRPLALAAVWGVRPL
jgi:CDP-4-dehydro-6-deoxyglucose reductase, E3